MADNAWQRWLNSLSDEARGLSQGITRNWGDEATGAILAETEDPYAGERAAGRGLDAPIDGRTPYEVARDQHREQNASAEARSPLAYQAGVGDGTMIATAPLAAVGGGLAGTVATGAADAAVAGAGESEASTPQEVGMDALHGGIQGGVSAGLTHGLVQSGGEAVQALGRVADARLPRRAALNTLADRGIPSDVANQAQVNNSLLEDADVLRPTRGLDPHEIQAMSAGALDDLQRMGEVDPSFQAPDSIFDDADPIYNGPGTEQPVGQSMAPGEFNNRMRGIVEQRMTPQAGPYSRGEPQIPVEYPEGAPQEYPSIFEDSFYQYTESPQPPRGGVDADALTMTDPNIPTDVFERSAPVAPPVEAVTEPGRTNPGLRVAPEPPPEWGTLVDPPRSAPRRAAPRGRAAQETGRVEMPTGPRPEFSNPQASVANPDVQPPRNPPRLYDEQAPADFPGAVGAPGQIMRDEMLRPYDGPDPMPEYKLPSDNRVRVIRQRMDNRLNVHNPGRPDQPWDRVDALEGMRNTSRIQRDPLPELETMGGRVSRQRPTPALQPPEPQPGTAELTNPGMPPEARFNDTMNDTRPGRPLSDTDIDSAPDFDDTAPGSPIPEEPVERGTAVKRRNPHPPVPPRAAPPAAPPVMVQPTSMGVSRGANEISMYNRADDAARQMQGAAAGEELNRRQPEIQRTQRRAELLRLAGEGVAGGRSQAAQKNGPELSVNVRGNVSAGGIGPGPGLRARMQEGAMRAGQAAQGIPDTASAGRWTAAMMRAGISNQPEEVAPSVESDTFDAGAFLDQEDTFDAAAFLDEEGY